jgi:hypothetical protein
MVERMHGKAPPQQKESRSAFLPSGFREFWSGREALVRTGGA